MGIVLAVLVQDGPYWEVDDIVIRIRLASMKSSARKLYYTITEAAKELGITRAAVHRAIKQGRDFKSTGFLIRQGPIL